MMKIFRSYIFHAARFIPTLKEEHPCSKMHGHTFNIIVEIEGEIDENTGFVMDFYDIDKVVNLKILKVIDHKILNEVPGLENPSSEYLSIWIWNKLIDDLPLLSKVTISEEHGTGMEYTGK